MSVDPKARLAELLELDEDLFDFPDVNGMSDLLAKSRQAEARRAPSASEPPAPLPQARESVAEVDSPASPPPQKSATPAPQGAAPKGPLPAPRNAGDLDEDLFNFGELLDLSASAAPEFADPLLDADPLAELAAEPWAAIPEAPTAGSPAAAPAPATKSLPVTAPDAASGQQGERKPKTKKENAKPTVVVREKKPAHAADAAAPAPQQPSAHGSPFLGFPEAIDLPPARSKLLWVLVACFLVANSGVFLLTQQQNQSVNRTLVSVTTTLAEAVARGATAAPRVAEDVGVKAPAQSGDSLVVLDSSDFASTHEFGLEHARRLIEQREYAAARKTLFRVLANQDRGTPMTVQVREDIDYLIAMTYFDEGRSIAAEVEQ